MQIVIKGFGQKIMLYSFLVLGYVPGTNIQLSFQAIMGLFVILVGCASIVWIEFQRRHRPRSVSRLRLPLHASQLHLRAQ